MIGIPFAAAAAGFVTFVKSNAKALLTLCIKSALRSPRGNGECGFCGSLRRGLQVVPTLQNPRRDRQSFSNRICCNAAAHRQRRFGKSSLPSISNSADFSMGTGDARAVLVNDLPCPPTTGAWHAPVTAPREESSSDSFAALHGGQDTPALPAPAVLR